MARQTALSFVTLLAVTALTACGGTQGVRSAMPSQLLFTAFGTHSFSCDNPQADNICKEYPAGVFYVPSITAGNGPVPADDSMLSNQPDPLEYWTLGGIAGNQSGIVAGLQAGKDGNVAYVSLPSGSWTTVTSFAYPITVVTAPLSNGTFFVGEASSGHVDYCSISQGKDQPCPIAFGGALVSASVNTLTLDPQNNLLWIGFDNGDLYQCPVSNPAVSAGCLLWNSFPNSVTSVAVNPNTGDMAVAVYDSTTISYVQNAGQNGPGAMVSLGTGSYSMTTDGPYNTVAFANTQLYALLANGNLLAWPTPPTGQTPATIVGTFDAASLMTDQEQYGKASLGLATDGTSVYTAVSSSGSTGGQVWTWYVCAQTGACQSAGQAGNNGLYNGIQPSWSVTAIAGFDSFIVNAGP